MSVQFYGEERHFEVVGVVPSVASGSGGPANSSLSFTLGENLGLDMSGLSLQTTPTKAPGGDAGSGEKLDISHLSTSTPKHKVEVQRSGGGMEPDEVCLKVEPESDSAPAQNITEHNLCEVVVCKVSSKTKVHFIEEKVQESKVSSLTPCVPKLCEHKGVKID